MPELRFTSRWPDGQRLESWSPSLVVHDHLEAGRAYPVGEFVDRAGAALTAASDRVQARWGRPCTAALASLATIRLVAQGQPDGVVVVEAMDPPTLPPAQVRP